VSMWMIGEYDDDGLFIKIMGELCEYENDGWISRWWLNYENNKWIWGWWVNMKMMGEYDDNRLVMIMLGEF
jgi:hypothetical protein